VQMDRQLFRCKAVDVRPGQLTARGPKQEAVVRQVPGDQRAVARARGMGKSVKLSRRRKTSRVVLGQRSPESRQAFNLRKPAFAASIPAAAHRRAIEASRQRFTFRVTRRIVPCTWQRWIGVWRPNVARTAFESAFAPSRMNRRGTLGSSPRSIRLSSKAWAAAAFSVAPT